jgi:hypothetical protein
MPFALARRWLDLRRAVQLIPVGVNAQASRRALSPYNGTIPIPRQPEADQARQTLGDPAISVSAAIVDPASGKAIGDIGAALFNPQLLAGIADEQLFPEGTYMARVVSVDVRGVWDDSLAGIAPEHTRCLQMRCEPTLKQAHI